MLIVPRDLCLHQNQMFFARVHAVPGLKSCMLLQLYVGNTILPRDGSGEWGAGSGIENEFLMDRRQGGRMRCTGS